MYELGYYYEKTALNYLRNSFEQIKIEHMGSTLPFVNEHDVYIYVDTRVRNQVFSIEIKGTQIIDEAGPRFNRVKITRKDITNPPDLFLIVIDVSQLGDSHCSTLFKLVWATDLIDIIKKPYTRNNSVSFIQISQISEADPMTDEF